MDVYTVITEGTTRNMLLEFLEKVGLPEKDRKIFLALAEIGIQPASVVGRRLNIDRVSTYKHLKKMAEMGLLKIYIRDSIQCFGVASVDGLQAYLQEQASSIDDLLKQVPSIEQALQGLSKGGSPVPELEMFEGKAGMKALFKDILFEARSQRLTQIRMLTSNTFDQRIGSVPLSKFMGEFFEDAKKAHLVIDVIEVSGTLLPERLRKISPELFRPQNFPASRGTTNVFLIGSAFYIACYSEMQIGLKIKQDSMSQVFHFFFDVLGKNVES